MVNQLDYNLSRKLEFQRNLFLFDNKNLLDLELESFSKNTQKHLKFLLIDLYASSKESKDQLLSVSMSKRGYKAKSRYNPNQISSVTINAVKILKDKKLIDFFPGFFDSKRRISRLSRIAPQKHLTNYFQNFKFSPKELNNIKSKEYIFLYNKDNCLEEYEDNFETHELREVVKNYNSLLSKTFFDIPCLEKGHIQRGDNSKVIISDYCKNSYVLFQNNINECTSFVGNWWSKLDLMSIQKYSNHMIINDSSTSFIDLSDLFLIFLQKKFKLGPVEFRLESLKRKFEFLTDNSQIYMTIEKLINNKNFASFLKSFWNIRKKIGIDESVKERDLKRLISFLYEIIPDSKNLFFSRNFFSWGIETSKVFLKLLKNFSSMNINIPIIKINDRFYYPTSLESNVLEYFESIIERELKKKIKIRTKKCYQYEASKSKSIFKKLVINNLKYSIRYKNNKKNFISLMKQKNQLTNHPIQKN